MLRATMACTFSTSQLPKMLRAWCALYILTSTCASRHNGAHFIISFSKNVPKPKLVCFVHFDLDMCFAPQRRALFRHRNFQKCSENSVFVRFDFETCFAPQRRAIFHLSSPDGSAPVIHDLSTFSRTCIFFLLGLSLL